MNFIFQSLGKSELRSHAREAAGGRTKAVTPKRNRLCKSFQLRSHCDHPLPQMRFPFVQLAGTLQLTSPGTSAHQRTTAL